PPGKCRLPSLWRSTPRTYAGPPAYRAGGVLITGLRTGCASATSTTRPGVATPWVPTSGTTTPLGRTRGATCAGTAPPTPSPASTGRQESNLGLDDGQTAYAAVANS